MAIKGKTFDLQTITAKDDGALYRILSGESDMIVFSGSGTALSINSNILTIAECYLLVGGRYIHIEGGSTIDLGTIPNSSNRGRVIIKIDTSLGATQVTLDQVVPEIETIASGGSYRALVKNDINSDNGGSVYEIEFCTFTCSSGVASSPALTTSVPTQTKIQALQDDIDTLADNLEQTGSDVGDLQTGKANAGLGTPTASDCNNITTAGWYWINPSITTTNLPSANYGILEVTRATGNDNGIILQRFTRYESGKLTIFERMYSNSTWTSWHQLTNSPVPIANGGTGATSADAARANINALLYTNYTTEDDPSTTSVAAMYSGTPNADCWIRASFNTRNFIALKLYNSASNGAVLLWTFNNRQESMTLYTLNSDEWYEEGRGMSIVKVTYTNTALTGLTAKQLSVASSEVLNGRTFGTLTNGRNYITLPAGTYKIHTNFRANPGANGFIKTCLKIGNTSTLFIITDQFYAGAGCGTNGSIIGVNATDVITLTASTNIYFLVMSQNATDGCEGSLTIERLG